MRQRRRWILSLILAGALCLSGVSTPPIAAVAAKGEAGDKSRVVQVIEGLGITSGIEKELSGDPVTREELAILLVRLTRAENELGAPALSDIEGRGHAAEMRGAAAARLMLAYEDGTFRPDEAVTWEMALRSMLALTGYDRVVSKEGNPFLNNRKQANLLGMLTGLSPEEGEITWEELCRLVYNTLDVHVLYTYSNGEEHLINDSEQTVLSFYLKLKRFTGVVQSVGEYCLSGVRHPSWGTAVVDGTELALPASYDLLPLLGLRAEVYCTKEPGDAALVCAVPAREGQVLREVSVREILNFDEAARQVTYQNEQGRRDQFYIPADADVLLNGSLIAQPLKTVLDETVCGGIRAVDYNADGTADVFLISRQDVYVVDSVNTSEETVYIKVWQRDGTNVKTQTEKLSLKDLNQLRILDQQGYVRALGELKAWDVIVVEENQALRSVSVTCPFESVMGKAELVSGTGSEQEITIEGKAYELSRSYFTKYGQAEPLEAGGTYTLKLDADGRVAAVVKSKIGKGQAGYLINFVKDTSSPFGGGNAQLKILTEDGQIQLLSAGKARIDGISCKDGDEVAAALTSAFAALQAETGAEVAQLVIYEVNGDQEVVSINTPHRSSEEDENSFRAVPLFGAYGFVYKLRRSDTIEGNYRIDAGASVFVIPPGGSEAVKKAEGYNFMVKNALAHLGDGIQNYMQGFKYTDGSYNLDVLVAQQGGEAAINADTPIQLVKDCVTGIDEEGGETAGMEVITIDVWGGRNEATYYAADPALFQNFKAGDVVQLVLNDKGMATYARPILYVEDPVSGERLSLKKPCEPDDGQWNNYSEPSKVLLAGAYCKEEHSLVVNRGPKLLKSGAFTPAKAMDVLAAEETDPTRLSGFTGSTYIYPLDQMKNVFLFDTKSGTKQFIEADKTDIIDYKSDPEHYSTMLLFTYWGGERCAVIYQ